MSDMASGSGGRTDGCGRDLDLAPALLEKPAGLPPGKYVLVGWDVDTTGRRLIDEICQIAAYTPTQVYAQYIMPYGDLNPGARRRHNVRVVTVGRYRMLKDTITQRVIKTKSEVSVLNDFIDWLERVKGDNDGIILIYHEPRRLMPTMLIEALNRYKLLPRFQTVVSGFADSYALTYHKWKNTIRSVTLRTLARVILNDEAISVDTALDRAICTYKIMENISQKEELELGACGEGSSDNEDMLEIAREWTRPVQTEREAHDHLQELLMRQNTCRAVFIPLLQCSRPERKRYTKLRRLLAEAGLLFDQLKDAWHHAQIEGLELLMAPLLDIASEEDVKELIEIFDCYFDPAKEPRRPRTKNTRNSNTNARRDDGSVHMPADMISTSETESSVGISVGNSAGNSVDNSEGNSVGNSEGNSVGNSPMSVNGMAAAMLMCETDFEV